MATTISGISQTKVISNLDTYNHTALLASMYVVDLAVSELPPSGIIITIQQNGVTKATTTSAPQIAQQLVQLRIILNCSINDLISVIVSSANPSDSGPNAFKGILKIIPGTI
jgi:hypothetical protein